VVGWTSMEQSCPAALAAAIADRSPADIPAGTSTTSPDLIRCPNGPTGAKVTLGADWRRPVCAVGEVE